MAILPNYLTSQLITIKSNIMINIIFKIVNRKYVVAANLQLARLDRNSFLLSDISCCFYIVFVQYSKPWKLSMVMVWLILFIWLIRIVHIQSHAWRSIGLLISTRALNIPASFFFEKYLMFDSAKKGGSCTLSESISFSDCASELRSRLCRLTAQHDVQWNVLS